MNKDFFIEALEQKKKSCDPGTQVGCVIVKDNEIVSSGYNTLASGLNPNNYPLNNRGNGVECFDLDTKYPYILHSEAKAIVNAKCDLSGASMYVTLFPCNECAKIIIQSGIKEVVYLSDKYANSENNIASRKLFDKCKVKYHKLENKDNKEIKIEL